VANPTRAPSAESGRTGGRTERDKIEAEYLNFPVLLRMLQGLAAGQLDIGMLGSIVMMSWVWFLESRRAAKHHGPTSVPRDR
jgi:hypothetical protein